MTLPYFELVEDGTTPMSLMAPISEYVNADTTDPGEGSVAMYYGAKLMNWYSMDLANGDTVDGAREKARMFIKYSLDAKADPVGLWDRCSFCLACVKYAWENDSLMDLLTAMGAAPLGWTADDVEVMSQALMKGFDELMNTAVFSRETDEKILARLLQGAAVCIGFAGDSAPKASAKYEGMLILPEGTVTVEANAFEGVAAEGVIIPDSCRSIGSCAFKDCPNLSVVGMPRDCDIADDAFEGCGLVTLYAPSGGTVEAYANSHPNCDFMQRDY